MIVLETYSPPTDPLDIIYQDELLIVLNKPSGLLSVPGRPEAHKDSLANRVQSEFPTATVVHRLDMETSGVIVMALTRHAHRFISQAFERRLTEKTYEARVDGLVGADQGEIDQPLIVDWPNRPRQIIDHEVGKNALTRYEVIEREKAYTRLALYPVTGRTHQLRVHCLHLGHVILGDQLYGSERTITAADNRLQLHATSLTINHPESRERITFTSPVPF